MLEGLCGSKSVQNILLFLFVNGKGYGAQIQKQLKCPLTPLQKAFLRLEKSGIILSFYEGKTRLFQFNPSYPLLDELELLLKKAYSLLAPIDRKRFNYVAQGTKRDQDSEPGHLLPAVWKRLLSIKRLAFHAKTKSKDGGGWNGKGLGEVIVTQDADHVLTFHEKGSWKDKHGHEIDFSNVYRWTYESHVISLEHLRHGIDHPVFLFHLAPQNGNTLASIDSHLCDGDAYFGKLSYDRHGLRLHIRVIGPKKNEEIETFYT